MKASQTEAGSPDFSNMEHLFPYLVELLPYRLCNVFPTKQADK
jgi:hypothetical protein